MDYQVKGDQIYRSYTTDGGSFIQEYVDRTLHSELTYSNGTITATIYDYQEQMQATYNNPVTFVYDGNTITVNAVNGVASITFSSTVTGDHVISTTNTDMRNGSVTVHV